MEFCPYCGLKLAGASRFCPACGKALTAGEKQSPPKTEKKEKTPPKKGDKKTALLKVGNIALLALILLALVGGVVTALCLSLRTASPLNRPSGENTTDTDGVLQVALEYGEDALLFREGNTARINLVLTNTSEDILRDLSMELSFPEGLRYMAQEEALRVDVLSPGASYRVSLPVEKNDAIANNFTKSLLILVGAAVLIVLLLILYAKASMVYAARLRPVTAAILILAMLLPMLTPVVLAAQEKFSLVYEEGSDVATALARTRTAESSFKLGEKKDTYFSYTAEYTQQQRITLDARLSEDGQSVTLQWNGIDEADVYCIYVAEYGGEFTTLLETEEREYTMDAPGADRIWLYRVAAQTPQGDLYTNDLQLIVSGQGAIFADNDADALSNEIEAALGTSAVLYDTDGDGLSDYEEVALTMTDPLRFDTDGNGVPDSEEDPDQDGLTNKEELLRGTSPLEKDTDRDGLNDRFEIDMTMTDPLNPDTDGDGLWDESEYLLGTDPLKADSDDNGVNDSKDTHTATLAPSGTPGIQLQVTDSGDNLTAAEVTDITDNTIFAEEDYVASPITQVTVSPEAEATVTLPVSDPSRAEEVVIVVYNQEDNDFRVLEDYSISADGTTVSAVVSPEYIMEGVGHTDGEKEVPVYRSTYVALYIANWRTRFASPLSPDRDGNICFDVAFVIDESSSMEDNSKGPVNDPERYRIQAAKTFTQALQPGDRASVVGFNDVARRKISLTEDMVAVRSAIDSIVGNAGGTALYTGLEEALEELIQTYDASRGRFIIAMTDGEDSSGDNGAYDRIIEQCISYEIPIYTISLGSSVNTALLTKLATYTGGAYIPIQSADDLPQVFNRIENTAFFGDDTDGDGLADVIEEYGLRDGTGAVYFTDKTLRFTDGDDLSDGEEAGNVMYLTTDTEGQDIAYYIMLTDPTKEDTDGDGVDDLDELVMKTLPWCSDTDNDGLSDGEELAIGYDPVSANPDGDRYDDSMEKDCDEINALIQDAFGDCGDDPAIMVVKVIIGTIGQRDPYTYDLSAAEKGVALLEGALLGDFGDILSEYGIVDSRHTDSIYYYIGGVIISFIPYANVVAAIRDTVACAIEGDWVGAALNLTGVIPGNSAVIKTVEMIGSILGYVQDGAEAAAEYPSKLTAKKAAAAPAMVYLLLRIYRKIEATFDVELGSENVKAMIEDQIDMGVQGLTKKNIENWEAFLSYGDQTQDADTVSDWSFAPYWAADALPVTATLQLDITNESIPLTLVKAVRAKLGQKPGGQITTGAEGVRYTLTRTLDLECAEYQDPMILEAALRDAVDRVGNYVDPAYMELDRCLQLVVTDALVSRDGFDALEDIADYAADRDVTLEYYLYLTTDDNDYNATLENIEKSEKKDAIIILPGISGSELMAGEDYTGALISSISQGEVVWLPEAATEFMNGNIGGGLNDALRRDGIKEVVDALNMLQMDSRGNSLYSIQPAAANASTGAQNCGQAMYNALEKALGQEYDVVFYSYDWRKTVATAAQDLQTYIDARGYESVSFVCHSMGGIVCSYYLAMDEANMEKTEQVITVGTPYGGSPKAAFVFETGRFLDNNIPLINQAFRQLARNLPSVYELLPYDDTIGNHGGYLSQNGVVMDAAATSEYLKNNDFDLNDQMIQNALQVQQALYEGGEHIMNHEAVDCTIIAGYNYTTLSMLYTDGERITMSANSKAGDGTVPLVSAIESNGRLFDNPIYLVNGVDKKGREAVNHSELFSDEDVVALVVNLLSSGEPGDYNSEKITMPGPEVTTAAQAFQAILGEPDSVDDSRGGVFDGIYDVLVAYCPVALSLYDQRGELVGTVSSEGVVVENEEDLALFELLNAGETKQVVIPEGYSVQITGEDDGTMDLMHATVNASGQLMQTRYYEDIAVSQALEAEVAVNTRHEVSIRIDSDGDGKAEQKLGAEDGVEEIYIPLSQSKTDNSAKVWILVGISMGLTLATAVALLIITGLNRPGRKKKKT